MAAEYVEFGLAGLFPLLMAALTCALGKMPRPRRALASRTVPGSATHPR